MSYSDKLKDPRWQKMRLEILERDGFACRKCEANDKTLHVHHFYYTKGAAPWEYEPSALITLCEDCHEDVEESKAVMMKAVGRLLTSRSLDGYAGFFAVLRLSRYVKHCEESGRKHISEINLLNGACSGATYESGVSYALDFFKSQMEAEGLSDAYRKITSTEPTP